MTDRAARAYPPTGQLLQVAGTVVHADVRGAGPNVILIHGASGNSRDFTFDLANRLAAHYRVISVDRPGLGHSPPLHDRGESPAEQAAVLDAAAAALDVDRAVLVGHSYGGAVVLAWALDHPGRVAAVVSLAGASMPWPGDLGAWYAIASSALGGATVIPLISALAPRGLAQRAIDTIFTPQQAPEGYDDYVGVALTLRAETLRANARQVNGLRPHIVSMAKRYPSLHLPVEIVHGTADTIVPLSVHSARLVETLPDARLTVLEGVGHMPHHADPEAVVAAIDRAAARAGLR